MQQWFHKEATSTYPIPLQDCDSLISKEGHESCSGSTDMPSTEQIQVHGSQAKAETQAIISARGEPTVALKGDER